MRNSKVWAVGLAIIVILFIVNNPQEALDFGAWCIEGIRYVWGDRT